MTTTFHDPENHKYIHIPCPEGITINNTDVDYFNILRFMTEKQLKEECKKNKCKQSFSGYSNKEAKKMNLIVKKLNRKDWWDFSYGEQKIINHFFI
jgi:hypothetical protein